MQNEIDWSFGLLW